MRGRKSKAKELKAYEYGKEAIISAYGTEQAFWLMIAEKATDSHQHLKLLMEYTYGRSPQAIEVKTEIGNNMPSWFTD
jgi:hypothetical protein